MYIYIYICVCGCVCGERVDFDESVKMIKIRGKVDKSNTYNGFRNNISFFINGNSSVGTLAQRLGCSPMARETWVQSQVESYQRL